MATEQQKVEALRSIVNVILDAAKEAGDNGLPAGPLYAQLMVFGCTLANFETLMSTLVATGKLRKAGHLYFTALRRDQWKPRQ